MKIKAIRPYSGPVDEDGLVPVFDISVRPLPYYTVGDKSPIVVSNSKRVGMLDINALMGRGAVEAINDANQIRGQQNEDYWFRFMQGHDPAAPKVPKVWQKFVDTLRASGVNVVRQGPKLNLLAMTNKDVDHLSEGRRVHTSDTVEGNENLRPIKGGLFDPAATGSHNSQTWSSYHLPEPMLSGVMEDPARRLLGLTKDKLHAVIAGTHELPGFGTGPAGLKAALAAIDPAKELEKARQAVAGTRKGARDDAIRKFSLLKQIEKTGIQPADWMLDKIPILPTAFRPISMMGNVPLVHDANYLYGDVIESAKNLEGLKKSLGDAGVGPERLGLYKSFQALTGLTGTSNPKLEQKRVKGLLMQVFGPGGPKTGMMQRKLLSNTVDNVGRGVISPDSNLDMDQIGLPVESALDTYKMFIVRRMRKNGIGIQEALHHIKNRDEDAVRYLKDEMAERPVYANRAPVWHKFGFLAMKPQLAQGDTLRINPTVLAGLGGDYDGDAQFAYVFCGISVETGSRLSTMTPGLSSKDLEDRRMARGNQTQLPALVDGDVYAFHLSEFPHGKLLKTTQGQHGPIDWFDVPEGVKVLAVGPDGSLAWTQTSVWSVHRDCPVEIVTLASGRQIFTDDDPRAVFGVPAGSLQFARTTPSDAIERKFLVPRVVGCPTAAPEIRTVLTGKAVRQAHRIQMRSELPATSDLGYLIGVAAGDGWATASGTDFVVAGISWEVIQKLDRTIPDLFDGRSPARCTVESKQSYGESRRHTWSNRDLCEFISVCVGRGSRNKHLPSWFLRGSQEFRKGLFAGLMDTDGTVSISNGKAKPQLMAAFFSTSLRLCQDVSLLAASLGIRGRITATNTPAKKDAWVLSFSNTDFKAYGGEGMVHTDKLAKLNGIEIVPSSVAARYDLIPISSSLAKYLIAGYRKPKDTSKWVEGQAAADDALRDARVRGYVSRTLVPKILNCVSVEYASKHEDWVEFMRIAEDRRITWDPVKSVEKTGQKITAYDLTVPGFETFTDVHGVVLSNTMNFHVPTTAAAVKEAEGMLPSRNIIAVNDLKSVVGAPRQEFLGGLHRASTAESGRHVRTFATAADALAAYERGDLNHDDRVEILRK